MWKAELVRGEASSSPDLEPIGVPGRDAIVRVQSARARDEATEDVPLGEFMGRCEKYFGYSGGQGRLIDQPFQPGITEGMLRCYFVKKEVVGFARQYPRGLSPAELERWWGPPTHPATVVHHDLTPGGRVTYYMTGPDGEKYHGWWRISSANPVHLIEFENGFADEAGNPIDAMPTTNVAVRLTTRPRGRTTMVMVSRFASIEDMNQLLAMGHDEGLTLALGQTDAILATGGS